MKKVKLSDLCTRITKGTTPTTLGGGFVNSGINFVKSESLSYELRYLDQNKFSHITIQANNLLSRSKLAEGDILMSIAGVFLGKTVIVRNIDLPANTNQAVAIIRVNPKLADKNFIYYYLNQKNLIKTINNSSAQSAQPNFNLTDLGNIDIVLPENIFCQKAIADVLSSFDDKIELNNKIIKNLEEQAQSLYKHWFIDFEFPDENGKPYKSSGGKFKQSELGLIPEDWEVKKMGSFFPVVTGKQNANVAGKTGLYPFFSCSQDILYCDNYSFDDSAILLAGNGDFSVKVYSGKFEAYQRTYVLIPHNKNYLGFLFYVIKMNLQDITKGFRGSVIKFITKGNIGDYKIAYSNNTKALFEYLNKNIEEISNLKAENQKLAETRDYLLPKLISGEVKVTDIK